MPSKTSKLLLIQKLNHRRDLFKSFHVWIYVNYVFLNKLRNSDQNKNSYYIPHTDVILVFYVSASDFRMNKTNTQLKVKEGEQLMLSCSVDGIGSDSTLRYSLTWIFIRDQSSSVTLLTYSYDGRLIFNNYNSELEGRLHFSSPEVGVFHLAIHRAIQEDRGRYYCQVHQYQLDCKGTWSHKASDKSGYTNVSVQLIGECCIFQFRVLKS